MLRNITFVGFVAICLLTGCASNTQPQQLAPSNNIEQVETDVDPSLEVEIEEEAELIETDSNQEQITETQEGLTIEQLIPEGWEILADFEQVRAQGDLNGDGIDDIAVVLQEVLSSTDGAPLRSLLLALGDSNETYIEPTIAANIVYLEDEGGVFGDPFGAVSIEDGIVSLEHYGGSNWRWSNTYRISWKADNWFLVGYTSTSEHTSSEEYEIMDYNLESGVALYERVDEDGNQTEDIVTVDADQTIIMDEFDREQFSDQLISLGLQ